MCDVPCRAMHEMTFSDKELGLAGCGEAVVIERPRGAVGDFEAFLADLCARLDAELAAAPLKSCGLETTRSRGHEDVLRMWQRFREVVDLPAYRALLEARQAIAKPHTRGTCFEVRLKKEASAGSSHGFAVHRLEAYDSVLVVDDITLAGGLDSLNQQMRALDRLKFCVHPLAVIIAVNGFSDHSQMMRELQKPAVLLHVVNPPSVVDVVAVYDLLKDGGALPAPFWETCGVALHADMSMDSAQMPDATIPSTGLDLQGLPTQYRPFSQDPIGGPSAASAASRRQLPEFSGDAEGKPFCWRSKGRGCVPVEQMDECLQTGPPTCGGPAAGQRRNFF